MKKIKILIYLILFFFLFGCGGRNSPVIVSSNNITIDEEELQKNLLLETYTYLRGITMQEIDGIRINDGFLYQERIPVEYKTFSDEDLKEVLYKNYGTVERFIESMHDTYSVHISKERYESMLNTLYQVGYGGIGVAIGVRENNLVILSVFKNSPAEKAGLIEGDIILEVDGVPMTNISPEEASSKIKGDPATAVKIKIRRGKNDGEILTFSIIRENIVYPSTYFLILDDRIGYLKINFFGANTTNEIKDSISNNIFLFDSLIIDLRNNSGGLLITGIEASDLFLSDGKIICIKDSSSEIQCINSNSDIIVSVPTIILLNEYTASSAEIFISALKENNVGVLIGEKSFGKGTIQTFRELSDGSVIKFTIAKFMTSNGEEIDEVGISPDINIDEREEDLKEGKDYILEEAKKYLKSVI